MQKTKKYTKKTNYKKTLNKKPIPKKVYKRKPQEKHPLHHHTRAIILMTVFALIVISIGVLTVQVQKKEVVGGAIEYRGMQVSLSDFPFPFIEDRVIVINSNEYLDEANRLSSALETRLKQLTPCVDSDGRNYYTFGRMVSYAGNIQYEDSCVNNVLTEYSCSVDGTPVYEIINCKYGCDESGTACNYGDDLKVFATSNRYNGDIRGVAGADEICNNAAHTAGLSGTYKAWISTSNETSPDKRFYHSKGKYVLATNDVPQVIADNWNYLTNGSLKHPIDRDEYGRFILDILQYPLDENALKAWTSTNPDGTAKQDTCKGYETSSPIEHGVAGWINKKDYGWSSSISTGCSNLFRLYCFEQPAPLPEIETVPEGPRPFKIGDSASSLYYSVSYDSDVAEPEAHHLILIGDSSLSTEEQTSEGQASLKLASNGEKIKLDIQADRKEDIDKAVDILIEKINNPDLYKDKMNYEEVCVETFPYISNYGDIFIEGGACKINHAPSIDSVVLSSIEPLSTNDLYCNPYAISDPEEDNVYLIYNWYKNEEPLMILNMPFLRDKAKDYSGFSNNGEVNGAEWNGGWNGYYKFDGVDDYIDIQDNAVLNPSVFTIEAWINSGGWKDNYWEGTIVDKHSWDSNGQDTRGYVLRAGEGKISFAIGTSEGWKEVITNSLNLNINQWYYVAGVFDGNNLSIYVNGELKNQTDVENAVMQSSQKDLTIGARGDANDMRAFKGEIKNIRIYNSDLSSEQINSNFKSGLSNGIHKIVSQTISGGDSWQCEVIPNDGKIDGEAKLSNTVNIPAENQPPTIENTTIFNQDAKMVAGIPFEYSISAKDDYGIERIGYIINKSDGTITNEEEYMCSGLSCANTFTINVTEEGDYYITALAKDSYGLETAETSGFTINVINQSEAVCFDSDGQDYSVKGYVNGTFANGLYLENQEDACCVNCNEGTSQEGPFVSEYICENNIATRDIYECPDGCVDGACVENVTALNASDFIIEDDIGDYTFINSSAHSEDYGNLYEGDYEDNETRNYEVTIIETDSQAKLNEFLDGVDDDIQQWGATKYITSINGNVIYQVEEKDLIYWTDGLIIVAIDYAEDLERPDELLNAYLAMYPSDLGKVTIDYELESGWNLVSLPFVLDNYSVDVMFADIIDDIQTIYTYKNRDWSINNPGLDPALSDFNEFELGYAYWVKTNESIDFQKTGSTLIPASTAQGTLLPPPEITLTEGWNLIGVHSNKPIAASIYLKGLEGKYSSLWRYLSSPQGLAYGTLVEMTGDPILNPGEGYWIYITQQGGASFVPSTGGI